MRKINKRRKREDEVKQGEVGMGSGTCHFFKGDKYSLLELIREMQWFIICASNVLPLL